MSYRPTRIQTPPPPAISAQRDLVSPLIDSWVALEPSTTDRAGASLDRFLLRRSIGLVVTKGLCSHSSVERAIDSLRPIASQSLTLALDDEEPSAAAIFGAAATNHVLETSAAPILTRGLLMLRLASAMTASLLQDAEVEKADLRFWWEALGRDFGLWDVNGVVDEFSDLWADVVDAIEIAEASVDVSEGESVRQVSAILSREVPLTQFARAPLWLLGLD